MRALAVAVLVAVLAGSALASTGDPRRRHTAAGAVAAQRALLRLTDLPKGWKAKPAKEPSGSADVCRDLRPSLSDLTEVGYARSPSFSLGQSGAVSQWVRAFASARQAADAFSRTATIGLVSCLAAQLEAASTRKARISVTGRYRLALPKVARQVEGFRVVARTRVPSEHEQFDVVADVMVLRQGATLTAVTMTGFVKPLDDATETRLARTIASRLGAKALGA